jgi:hypothetical protein
VIELTETDDTSGVTLTDTSLDELGLLVERAGR